MMLYNAARRREARLEANAMEAVFYGYCGAKGGKDGAATRAVQQTIKMLRGE